MLRFQNDYSEGAHPQVLAALEKNNLVTTCGYSMDPFCQQAADTVRALTACPDADVHFIVGGTLANTIVISAALRPWEGVIAADTGHINVHETGAIEASGHKVCAIEAPGGKLTPALVRELLRRHCDGQDEHMVLPRMVYISDATELGTIYTKAELAALHEVCGEYGLYLFLDGARMAAALVAEGNDLQPEDFATYCDVFYLGGTKNGLLFGEAVVITNEALKPHFRNMIKQRGGMFAKVFLFGTQFTAYLQDELWLTMARHAVTQAQRIQTAAVQKGYRLFAVSPTNQVFPILTKTQKELEACDFLPFSSGIASGAPFVMVSHLSVPEVVGDETPSDLSSKIVSDLLRNKLGFTGVIITDSHQMASITDHYSAGDAAVKALAAGCDMILMPSDLQAAFDAVKAAVADGTLSQARIHESVLRILTVKAEYNILQ